MALPRWDDNVSELAKVRIVLVEPQESGNVGAAARAMKNFGLTNLTIVGSPRPLDEASVWWASGAEEIVDGARRVATLHEALGGAHLVIATSSGRGRERQPDRSPIEVAELRRTLGADRVMAIVFGRERSGLTSAELDLCGERATVPTSPEFPVMNLAQSVSLFCYELSRAAAAETPAPEASEDLASHDEIERVHERARRLLLQIGFLNPDSPDAIYGELRRFLRRSRPTERETTIFLGILRQMQWALDHPRSED